MFSEKEMSILLGLFATNLGEAWRLAEGADMSAKLFGFFDTFMVALSNPLPSFHPLDLVVGIVCGAGLRLAVYLKGKNAKKYRHIPDHRKCLTDYLAYAVQSKQVEMRDMANAPVVPILNKTQFSDIEINLPSLSEQGEIVENLNAVSQLITLRKEQLAKLDQLVKSRFVEMFGDPIANEKGWPMVTIADVAEIRIGPFGTLLHKEDYISGGHALVNPSHIVDGRIVIDNGLTISDTKYEELSAYHLQPGDVVLGRRGEMGRCAVVYENGLLCGTGSMIIRPNERMKPYFLQSMISNPAYKKIIEDKAVGVTMLNLNVPIVSALTVPQLPVELQEQFIAFMEEVDKTKLTIQASLDKLELLKKSLMQQYFG